MGGDKNLSVKAVEINGNEYTGLALLTDGFYSVSNWEKYLNELFHSPAPTQVIEKNTAELLSAINDDASVSMLRLPISQAFQLSFENVSNNTHYSKAMLQPFIYQELDKAFIAKDIPEINEIVKWMDKYQILDTKPNMILLLEKLIQFQATEATRLLTAVIRRM